MFLNGDCSSHLLGCWKWLLSSQHRDSHTVRVQDIDCGLFCLFVCLFIALKFAFVLKGANFMVTSSLMTTFLKSFPQVAETVGRIRNSVLSWGRRQGRPWEGEFSKPGSVHSLRVIPSDKGTFQKAALPNWSRLLHGTLNGGG